MKRVNGLPCVAVAVVIAALPLVGGCAPSEAPTVTEPTAAPAALTIDTPEPSVVLLAGDLRVAGGACTTLEWHVEGALRTYLDGRGVESAGTESVCPTETTTYTLTAALPDGSEVARTQVVSVANDAAGTEPPAPSPAATQSILPTLPPATPAVTVTVTATATVAAVIVEFYPDNNIYEIGKDDKCTAAVWRTSGVTNLQLEREGMGRKDVGASGREEVCFETQKVTYYLYYKTPGGAEERAELLIRRKN